MPCVQSSRARWVPVVAAALVGAVVVRLDGQSQTAFERARPEGTAGAVTGTLTALHGDDFDNGRSEVRHFIRDERTNTRFEVHFERGAPPTVTPGARMTISGRINGQEVYVAADATTALPSSNPGQLPTFDAVAGDQKTLVIVANFQDVDVTCSIASITDYMFTDPNGLSVDAVYRNNSDDCVWFSGTVVGPYLIDYASTGTCDPLEWAEAADAQAVAAGVDVAAHPRKVYVLPPNSCPMSGYGSVGSATSAAFVFRCNVRRIYQHELGHNLGMMHASSLSDEYGDNTDPMGIFFISNVFGFNAPHRHQMGWLAEASVQLVDQEGTFELAPLGGDAVSATAPRALIIRKPDTGEYYYVSYRYPVGYDRYIDGLYFYRSTIHRFRLATTSHNTYIMAGLADAERFVDAPNGITVTQVGHDATHATLRVTFEHTCTVAAPSLTVPWSAQSGPAGTHITYSLAVTNNDAATCPSSTFALSGTVPTNWTSTLSPAVLSLAPGTTGTAALTVASPATAPATTSSLTLAVSSGTTPVHAGSVGLTYTVLADVTAPSVPGNLRATLRQKQKQIQLTWSAASDAGGVAGYVVQRNGVTVGASSTTDWVDSEWNPGSTYNYAVRARDAAGNQSSSSNSATVTLSGGGGKGK